MYIYRSFDVKVLIRSRWTTCKLVCYECIPDLKRVYYIYIYINIQFFLIYIYININLIYIYRNVHI